MPAAVRCDGRVAIVTGAGAGLGRLYALGLAKLGAKVVVNDFSKEAADRVVAEIVDGGGSAVANYSDVADGEAVVATALSNYGTVHILVNNAGVLRDKSFARMTRDMWDIVYKTHLLGAMAVCKAAWEPMSKQKYGRIVNITSVNGLYGQIGQANYSAAKSGVVGLSKTLAKEGAKNGIKVNVIAPGAGTAMTATIMPQNIVEAWKPDYVAPLVLFLCSEGVPCSGSIFESGGGWAGEVKFMRTAGVYFDIGELNVPGCPFGPDDIAAKFDQICDFSSGAVFPDDVKKSGNPMDDPQIKQILAKL